MSSSSSNPWWLQVVLGLFPLLTALIPLLTGYFGFKYGARQSKQNLEIAKEQLEHQKHLETEKLLRDSRAEKIRVWRQEITKHTASHVETKATIFRYQEFSRTEAYLSLRGHLSRRIQQLTENTDWQVHAKKGGVTHDQSIKESLLTRIDELEKEWELV